jgi:hypothetical protein
MHATSRPRRAHPTGRKALLALTTLADADGRLTLSVEAAVAGGHGIVVEVPATANDKDTGAAVGTAFTLKAPPTGTSGAHEVFVSPFTTLVVDVAADRGLGRAEAAAAVQSQLGLANSPVATCVSGADAQAATLRAASTR